MTAKHDFEAEGDGGVSRAGMVPPRSGMHVYFMSFEKLRVYKAAQLLDRGVRTLLAGLAQTDDIRQLRRAIGSILFNIAEAFGSQYVGRTRYHLVVARGSADETRAILRRMADDGVFTTKAIARSCALTSVIAKMLTAWIGRL